MADEAPRLDPMELHRQEVQRRGEVHRLHRTLAGALLWTWQASRTGFVVAASLQVLGALAVSALVVLGKLTLDTLLDPGPTGGAGTSLAVLILLLAAVTAVGTAAGTMQQLQQRLLSEQVAVVAWRRVLDVTGRVGLEFYESAQFYDHLERVRANAVLRPITVTAGLFGLIGSAAGTIGLLVVLLAIDPLLVPVLLLAGIPAVLLSRRASRLEFRFTADATPVYRARDYLRQVLTGRDEAKEVRAFGAERALRGRHDERSADFMTALRRHVRVRQLYALGAVATTGCALVVALGTLAWFLTLGRIGLADAGAAALGIRLLGSRLDQMYHSLADLLESSVFLEDLDRFLGLAVAADGPGSGVAPRLDRAITLDGVSYTYPGSTTAVLDEVDLRIGAGEVVAIIGENGSGKTTLAKIIAGLYAPTSGSVSWDGVDTAALEPADVRRGVSVIFQDFVRYQLTALENIGLGDPDRADDEAAARAAADRAGAAGFLGRLPRGYRTILSKEFADGRELSIGQWQRVALARALRRDSPLVILDEPSSALDPRAEQALFADVRATLRGRTAVLISHRYSTVRTADRIYVMREGRVVEAGTHADLMAVDGLYAELFSLQARAYL